MSQSAERTTSGHVRPTKIQIRLRIRAVSSQSSFSSSSSFSAWKETMHHLLSKMRPVKILIRLCVCTGWSESLLEANVQRYVSWRYSSNRSASKKMKSSFLTSSYHISGPECVSDVVSIFKVLKATLTFFFPSKMDFVPFLHLIINYLSFPGTFNLRSYLWNQHKESYQRRNERGKIIMIIFSKTVKRNGYTVRGKQFCQNCSWFPSEKE